nr:hypothetical protein [Tanacetum cinerariifolium]
MLVRQAYSPTALDTDFKPLEDSLETEEPQPLSPTSVPLSPDYTPATPYTNNESKPYKTSETRVTSLPSPTLSPDPASPPSPIGHYLPQHHDPYTSTIILLPQYYADGHAYIAYLFS